MNFGGATWNVSDTGIWLESPEKFVGPELRRMLHQERVDGALALIRTRGQPSTMQRLKQQYGELIDEAAQHFKLPAAWIAAMACIEAVRIPGSVELDRFSLRDEDGRKLADFDSRPNRVSAGLMQTLLSTARAMASRVDLKPHFAGRPEQLDLGHLCVPRISLMLGAAYMRDRADAVGMDPIFLVGAYNAGGLYPSKDNPWNIRTYGRDRIPKFVAYHNDWLTLKSLETR